MAEWGMPRPALVLSGNQIQLVRCGLYAHYCAVVEAHHICPKSWFTAAGQAIRTPMANICPTCHMNTHTAIDGTIRGRDITLLPPRTRDLAAQAFQIAQENGLTPALTL